MKSDPELSSIPVVVFTASAGVPQQSRALVGGAADYLVKPLSATSLRESIARILR
jgi:CheY-like chemotaxis protein